MDSFDPLQSWITRTQSIDMHYRFNRFSGWSFGMGGEIGARLYDKTLEVEKKSKKFYLHEVWQSAGWDGRAVVWRMEFEAKRAVLRQLGIQKLRDLLSLQTALWVYLTEDWLRLAIPSDTDSNQTRWQTHPLWHDIGQVFQQGREQAKLSRFSAARVPLDASLFINGIGSLTSFMAREGIDDLGEGIGEFFHQAHEFHNRRLGVRGYGLDAYVGRKVRSKNRRFNTVNNRLNNADDQAITDQLAKSYKKASGGE